MACSECYDTVTKFKLRRCHMIHTFLYLKTVTWKISWLFFSPDHEGLVSLLFPHLHNTVFW